MAKATADIKILPRKGDQVKAGSTNLLLVYSFSEDLLMRAWKISVQGF